MSKNVIVMGMARSGTSLAASILANQGYFVADPNSAELQKPNKFNPTGYWEARSLLEKNTEILARTGFKADNTWFHEAITSEQAESIAELEHQAIHIEFVNKFNRNSPWIWKDPRLCYTLDYWWPLLDQENTCVVHVTRNPDEVFQSFLRVKDDWNVTIEMERSNIVTRINEHVTSAKKIIEKYGIPFITIDYSDYESSPERVAKELSKLVGLEIGAADFGYDKEAVATFESSKLQRTKRFIKRIINR